MITQELAPIVPLRTRGARPPLFLIHGRFGDGRWTDRLVPHLDHEQPVYALQSEGLDGRRMRATTVQDMARRHLASIRSVRPDGPYCLFGYSIGGLVAYELAVQLRERGEHVALLGLGDTYSPPAALRVRAEARPAAVRLARHRRNLTADGRRRWAPYLWRIARHRVRRTGGILAVEMAQVTRLPAGLRREYVGRVHDLAGRNYQVPTYDGRVVLFRSGDFDWLPDRGWSEFVRGTIDVVDLPGTHLSLIHEPYAEVLARRLDEQLALLAAPTP